MDQKEPYKLKEETENAMRRSRVGHSPLLASSRIEFLNLDTSGILSG